MVIRALASELYRAQRKVYEIEERLEKAHPRESEALKNELRVAVAERDQLRRLFEARKEDPPYRTGFRRDRDRF